MKALAVVVLSMVLTIALLVGALLTGLRVMGGAE